MHLSTQPQASSSSYAKTSSSSAFERDARTLVQKVQTAANSGSTEATIASTFEIALYEVIKRSFGLEIHPQKEKNTSNRLVSQGRIDSSYGEFIIEFKKPQTFKTRLQQNKAARQLENYLLDFWETNTSDCLGFLTDGTQGQFIRVEQGEVHHEAISELNTSDIDRITRIIRSQDQVALTPANLLNDFCQPTGSALFERVARTFYAHLSQSKSQRTQLLFEEWKQLFRLAHDDSTKQDAIRKRRESLQQIILEPITGNEAEYRALFALQTSYALIVKLIAYKVVGDVYFERSVLKFADLVHAGNSEIRKVMSRMEDGAVFRSAGIANLLEGDFFSWYSDEHEWNDSFANHVKDVSNTLSKYEDKLLTREKSTTMDLFRDLYQAIMPSPVRHSLGEFYTPAWLADLLVERALEGKPARRWRALDPCAGAGTFVTKLIEKVLSEPQTGTDSDRLHEVLSRVSAIDLNPLAVLTTRVNYFVNIASLAKDAPTVHIPVYLGDSSYVPQPVVVDDVACVTYEITTQRGPLVATVPRSALNDLPSFAIAMISVERHVKDLDVDAVQLTIEALCDAQDLNSSIRAHVNKLAKQLVQLEKSGWNGIWARILTNFLSTANLGKFDLVVGNPPWIDWKNLPAGYRERIKEICIDRHLFSGDRITGGINLNICALIANVSATNWLRYDGTLAFLMPESLLFQQTYEGFREFRIDDRGGRLYLQEVLDFTRAGHPFKPVQHRFNAYLYESTPVDYSQGVPVIGYAKLKNSPSIAKLNESKYYAPIEEHFSVRSSITGTYNSSVSAFIHAEDSDQLKKFQQIAGRCEYIGREGIEFYPQEVFLLVAEPDTPAPQGKIYVRNFQNAGKSKYPVPEELVLLETEFLYPLVKGIDIERYGLRSSDRFLVPFPYDPSDTRLPISRSELRRRSPLLAEYLTRHKDVIDAQTGYNARIIGKKDTEFYALARVGAYSFHNVHVAYRDNSKWAANVVGELPVPWGGTKRALFQNHAPSMCERSDGSFMSLDEAHYVAGVMNAKVVGEFIANSSDARTFKIRPPVHVPLFDPTDDSMIRLTAASRALAASIQAGRADVSLELEIERLYLKIASSR